MRCLAAIDEGVGQLYAALEQTKQLDNTLFVFTRDTGYFWGEHGLGDNRWAYGEPTRVPRAARGPGVGREAVGPAAGPGDPLRPPYPCHYYMHGAGRHGLQCLTNLDLLPPTGALLICPPLKIERGSGSPLRVLALVEDAV